MIPQVIWLWGVHGIEKSSAYWLVKKKRSVPVEQNLLHPYNILHPLASFTGST